MNKNRWAQLMNAWGFMERQAMANLSNAVSQLEKYTWSKQTSGGISQACRH